MKKRLHLLAVPLIAILAAGCGSGGAGNFNLISIEEEWQLGQQLARDIQGQMRVSSDPYVQQLGQRIVSQAPAPFNQLPWQFHVVDNPEVNAFAIPGGHIYIHKGLIAAADNASELAGVMAHEVSHVVARHSTEQISRQYGLSVLAGIVLGQNPAAYQELLANIVAGGALARFSREAESESDRIGLRLMQSAGYNPRGMVTMFQELLQREQRQPSAVERFFSTHPLTSERIRDVENQIAQLPANTNTVTDEREFQALRSRM